MNKKFFSFIFLFLGFSGLNSASEDKKLLVDQSEKDSLMQELQKFDDSFLAEVKLNKANMDIYKNQFYALNEKLFGFIAQGVDPAGFQRIRGSIIDSFDQVYNFITSAKGYKLQDLLNLLDTNLKKIDDAKTKASKELAVLPRARQSRELLLKFASVAYKFLKKIKISQESLQLKDDISIALGNLMGDIDFLKNKNMSLISISQWEALLERVKKAVVLYSPKLDKTADGVKTLGLSLVNNIDSLYKKRNESSINLRLLTDKFIDDIKTQIDTYQDQLDKQVKDINAEYAKDVLNFVLKIYKNATDKIRNNVNQYLELRVSKK